MTLETLTENPPSDGEKHALPEKLQVRTPSPASLLGLQTVDVRSLGGGGEPPRILEKARGDGPKDCTSNVSDISHSTRLDRCDRPNVKQLDEKPNSNQKGRRNQSDAYE